MAGGLAGLACAAATAAPPADGATQSMPGTSWWLLGGWFLLGAAALAIAVRAPWLRAAPRTGPAWPLRAEPSVFGFGAAFLTLPVTLL
jgi:hypothetical protein